MKAIFTATVVVGVLGVQEAQSARLNMALASSDVPLGFEPGTLRLDVVWTMTDVDPAAYDIDAFEARFNVLYPSLNPGYFTVAGVSSLSGWDTSITEGIGEVFSELTFFLSTADPTYAGISGNATNFNTTIASILLEPHGNVVGTEISFRHNSYSDPIPAAHDGPQDWQLRWQYEVTGPFQFDIGVGNPGDAGGDWTAHGYEAYQPLVIVPEPGPLVVIALAGISLLRSDRLPRRQRA